MGIPCHETSKIAVFGIRSTSCATRSDLTGYMPFRAMRPKLGIIGKWRFCYSERIFRVGRVARNVENACFRISWQCIRSRNAFHLCAKPLGTYRNVWSWNGFDYIKQHATERRNRFDQAVTASGATMQAGPDSLAETKMADQARKDSSFRECSSSDGCWHGDRCLAHGDYGADGCRRI